MKPLAALLTIALLAGPAAARKPKPPTGTILLDIADPVVEAKVAGVTLRLRVGLEAKPLIELNPDAAARLPIAFAAGFDAFVGRDVVRGTSAEAPVTIGGRPVIALLSSHGRPCCTGVDGVISPSLLPYAEVRFVRADTAPGQTVALAMADSDMHGLEAPVTIGQAQISVQFSLDRADSVATQAAGAILARAYGGDFEPGGAETPAAFGLTRPSRTLRFARSFTLAGFGFDRLITRVADFGGREEIATHAADDAPDDAISVVRPIRRQPAWPVVLIGRDRIDRCNMLSFETISHRLTLACDFSGGR
jgi:hypothetical protein